MFGVLMSNEQASRVVPKVALTLDEVEFSIGRKDLVQNLRDLGELNGKRTGRVVLFETTHVEEVARRYFAGAYDEQLEILRSAK